MNDLAKYVAHMTAAAEQASALRFSNTSCSQCGREFGPGNSGYSHCKDHDLEQQRAFAEWEREVDAVGESAEMDGLGRVPRWPGNGAPDSTVAVGSQCTPDYPSLQSPETVASVVRLIPASDDGAKRSAHLVKPLRNSNGGQAGETANPDAFNFAPACRELAAHFMPGAPGLSVDYFAQYLMDCVTEYLAIKEEFRK